MKAFIKKSKKIGSKETQNVKNSQSNSNGDKNQLNKNNEEGVTNPLVQSNNSDGKLNNGDLVILNSKPDDYHQFQRPNNEMKIKRIQ